MGVGTDLYNEWQTLGDQRDWAKAASLFASDGVHMTPSGSLVGPEAIEAFLVAWAKAAPDAKQETSMLIEDGDSIVAVWTNRATLNGSVPREDGTQIAVTGKALNRSGVTVATIRDGKFATMREYIDVADIARQLGLAPG